MLPPPLATGEDGKFNQLETKKRQRRLILIGQRARRINWEDIEDTEEQQVATLAATKKKCKLVNVWSGSLRTAKACEKCKGNISVSTSPASHIPT